MYIGKHKGNARNAAEDTIRIPENYAGNAFSSEEEKEESRQSEESVPATQCREDEPVTAAFAPEDPPVCLAEGCERSKPPFRLDKLFSSDALLILLAILFSGMDDGGEIAVILLLLLLF